MARLAKCAALLALAASLISATAIAGENEGQKTTEGELHVGQGVVCDTVQQVERFTTLMDETSGVEKAINAVNTEADNPRACGVVLAAFVRGDEVGEVRNAKRSVKVVEITILAVPVGDQWHFVSPLKQYTAFPVNGVEI